MGVDVTRRRAPISSTLALEHGTRFRLLFAGLGLGTLGLFLYSFTIGPYPIPVGTVVSVFLHRLHLADKSWTDAVELVVLGIRGPRIAAALLVGAALAMAGATFQNLF